MKKEFREKAKSLVDSMTLEEAASQIRYDSPAIERLGIPAYNWWNEGLHGLARAGTATVFPQAIALAVLQQYFHNLLLLLQHLTRKCCKKSVM